MYIHIDNRKYKSQVKIYIIMILYKIRIYENFEIIYKTGRTKQIL